MTEYRRAKLDDLLAYEGQCVVLRADEIIHISDLGTAVLQGTSDWTPAERLVEMVTENVGNPPVGLDAHQHVERVAAELVALQLLEQR